MKENVNVLLETIKSTSCRWNEEIIKSGISFNIISILGMENNERYTHSAFIAELLNPKGRHGQKNLFLNLFLETCEIKDFNYKNEESILVETEKFIGVVSIQEENTSYNIRTFLDIVITNRENNQSILIENKIWAVDQKYQLERYSKFKHHTLIYLTLDGKEYQTKDKDLKYNTISYKLHIIKWLDSCIQAVKPKSEKQALTIEMYKDTIEKLTNQSIYKNMNEEIKKSILLNEENLKAAELIFNNYLEIKLGYETKFLNSLENEFKIKNIEMKGIIGKYKYQVGIETENEGNKEVYLGFMSAEKENLNESEKAIIKEEIEKILNGFEPNTGSTTSWPIWFNPSQKSILKKGDLTFESLVDSNQLMELYVNTDKHAEEIAKYFISILEKLRSFFIK